MSDLTDQLPNAERRREPRYHVFSRAQLYLPGGQKLDARVRDISGSGLGLTADNPVRLATSQAITINVPDPGRPGLTLAMRCKVNVVSVVLSGHEYRIGASWGDLSGDARQVIDRWIQRLRFPA